MTTAASRRPALGSSSALAGVLVAFVANGFGYGAVGALTPALREQLHTDALGVGVLLMVLGFSAIVGINVGGRFSDAHGALRPMQAGTLAMGLGLLLLPWARSVWTACVAGVLLGFGNGALDVSMNALAVQVEQHRARPVMSRLHAFFSVGTLAVSLLVLLLGRGNLSGGRLVLAAMSVVGVALLVSLVFQERLSAQSQIVGHADEHGARSAIPRAAWLLGVMAICFAVAEGTAMDWSAYDVKSIATVSDSTAALGVVAVSATMVTIRLFGDAAVHLIGRRAVVRFGAAVAAAGYLIAVIASPLWLLLLGWAVVGLGMGLVAPQIYGSAGNLAGGRGLSIVVSMGYAAGLLGPGVIGGLVHTFGIARALIVPLALAAVLSALSVVMPDVRRDAEPEPAPAVPTV
ncbi:MFS transporter [Allobranchiibius sp. CTAmp26]|uniref:MFS transporter n=1 Tax=Allobranchiibius sp. CTAmp26 TaxID=2815214 RepID=UPI001AA14EBC|nr:MFS transporter [Allobranchiibius sp. CTAmp26]MBO1756122.1 MFS transporter [Allobranchiibius sp. CTAmp26]